MQIQAPDMHAMHEHNHCEKNIKAKADAMQARQYSAKPPPDLSPNLLLQPFNVK